MTTAISAKATRRKGIATNLIHVPVIFGNQLLTRWGQSRFGSYAKMDCGDLADGISPGGFFDRVARRLLVTLHSTSILRFWSFSLWPQIPARNPNQPSPGSASTVNGGAANTKNRRAAPVGRLRTTLTGADEPYNGQAVRARLPHLFYSVHRRTAHNFQLGITFLLCQCSLRKSAASRNSRSRA